jgi:outer membrane lipoprotein SlyB
MKLKSIVFAAIAAAALGGCAHPIRGGDYFAYEAGREQSVRYGVVDSVRDVRIQARETGVGAATGTMIGAIGGSHIGGGRHGSLAGFLGGAILGGLIGQEVERTNNEQPGQELVVVLDSGRTIAVVQDAEERFRAGDRVRVLSGRGLTRVTH